MGYSPSDAMYQSMIREFIGWANALLPRDNKKLSAPPPFPKKDSGFIPIRGVDSIRNNCASPQKTWGLRNQADDADRDIPSD
jgi:hypothetical protein